MGKNAKIELWKDRENRVLNPEAFSIEAERIAKEVADEGGWNKNKRSQLRKFFDEVVRLNQMAKNDDKEWENILPQVHMLSAQAAYAYGRKHVGDLFLSLVKDNISYIETDKDLDAYANFFEAFIGFYKLYGRD